MKKMFRGLFSAMLILALLVTSSFSHVSKKTDTSPGFSTEKVITVYDAPAPAIDLQTAPSHVANVSSFNYEKIDLAAVAASQPVSNRHYAYDPDKRLSSDNYLCKNYDAKLPGASYAIMRTPYERLSINKQTMNTMQRSSYHRRTCDIPTYNI